MVSYGMVLKRQELVGTEYDDNDNPSPVVETKIIIHKGFSVEEVRKAIEYSTEYAASMGDGISDIDILAIFVEDTMDSLPTDSRYWEV